jgi:hypothetical protein
MWICQRSFAAPKARKRPRRLPRRLLLNRLATGAVQMERLFGQRLRTDYPPPIRLNPSIVSQQAEDAAINLRLRLGVGLGPIPDPISLFELELSLRIFFRPFAANISGLYAHDPSTGRLHPH